MELSSFLSTNDEYRLKTTETIEQTTAGELVVTAPFDCYLVIDQITPDTTSRSSEGLEVIVGDRVVISSDEYGVKGWDPTNVLMTTQIIPDDGNGEPDEIEVPDVWTGKYIGVGAPGNIRNIACIKGGIGESVYFAHFGKYSVTYSIWEKV